MRTKAAFFIAFRLLVSVAKEGGSFHRVPRPRRLGRAETRYVRGAITGIALSLIPFVIVLIVADGMIEGITSRYLETYAYHFQASPLAYWGQLGRLNEAALKAEAVPGVIGAWPEIRGAALAVFGAESAPAMIRGIDSRLLQDSGLQRYLGLSEGDLGLGIGKILVGKSLATSLRLHKGDSVLILTNGSTENAVRPRLTAFRVSGIVSAGYRDLDELWAFVSLEAAARILPESSRQELIGIKVANPYENSEPIRHSLSLALNSPGQETAIGSDWLVRSWREVEHNLFASFSTTRSLLLVIMALTIGVAAINVSSALVMLVMERSRDIAILKSTGASNSFIAQVFLIAGGTTGLVGTLIGVTLGALISWKVNDFIATIEAILNWISNAGAFLSKSSHPSAIKLLDPAYYLERIPVRIDLLELVLVATTSLLMCIAASVLPALRAAKLPPLEIFRKT